MCGEHSGVPMVSSQTAGSSPRVRGTHGWNPDDPTQGGIIPACAGNTHEAADLQC